MRIWFCSSLILAVLVGFVGGCSKAEETKPTETAPPVTDKGVTGKDKDAKKDLKTPSPPPPPPPPPK